MSGFRNTVTSGLGQINFLLLPAAVVSIVLAEPIIRLVYERGAFDPEETTVVAQCLAAFSIGLAFNGMMLMLNRGFFSLQSPWTPTAIALVVVVLNTALYFVFYPVGAWGVPLAISLANIAGVGLLVDRAPPATRAARPRRDGVLVRRVSRWRALALGASPTASGGRSTARSALVRGAAGVGRNGPASRAAAVYLLACRALRVPELATLLSLRDRFRRDR